MSVGEGSHNVPWSGIRRRFATKPVSDGLDQIRGQMREITQGLMFDPASLVVGAAEQMRLVVAPLIDACRRGYMDRTASS
jgi:hypothetical protein